MKQLFRFIFIVAALWAILTGITSVVITAYQPGHSILDIIFGIIFVLFIAMAFFLAARWCNKGNTFDIKKDSLYVLKNMGICGLIYLSVGLIARLLYVFKLIK